MDEYLLFVFRRLAYGFGDLPFPPLIDCMFLHIKIFPVLHSVFPCFRRHIASEVLSCLGWSIPRAYVLEDK
jgi:hypothetical protein